MIAGGSGNDAPFQFFFREGMDLLVSAPKLEAEDFLLVFAFYQNRVAELGG